MELTEFDVLLNDADGNKILQLNAQEIFRMGCALCILAASHVRGIKTDNSSSADLSVEELSSYRNNGWTVTVKKA